MAKIIPFPLQKRIFQPYSGFYGYSSFMSSYYGKTNAKRYGRTPVKKSKPGKLIHFQEAFRAYEAKKLYREKQQLHNEQISIDNTADSTQD